MQKILKGVGIAVGTIVLSGLVYWLVVFYAMTNFHVVVDGSVYRSAQPSPEQIADWTERYKLKTVIRLRAAQRGDEGWSEADSVRAAGAHYAQIKFWPPQRPKKERLLALIDLLDAEHTPILLHCRAGADRAGLASVLAAMALGGVPYEVARNEMSVFYLRFEYSGNDFGGFFQEYEAWSRREGGTLGGWAQFKAWATEIYVP